MQVLLYFAMGLQICAAFAFVAWGFGSAQINSINENIIITQKKIIEHQGNTIEILKQEINP